MSVKKKNPKQAAKKPVAKKVKLRLEFDDGEVIEKNVTAGNVVLPIEENRVVRKIVHVKTGAVVVENLVMTTNMQVIVEPAGKRFFGLAATIGWINEE